MEANVEESRKLWSDVGAQWLAEEAKRDKRVKDRIEFPEEEPRHYPQNGKINRNYFCFLTMYDRKVLQFNAQVLAATS